LAQNGQPLTLKECIQFALQNNSELRNAERRRRISGTQVASSRAGILPSLNFSLSASRSEQGDRTVEDDVPVGTDPLTGDVIYERRTITQPGYGSNFHSTRLDFNQPLFDFGANWNRIRQASAAEKSSEGTYAAAKQNSPGVSALLGLSQRASTFGGERRSGQIQRRTAQTY
jgi:outer membrane protein TolC